MSVNILEKRVAEVSDLPVKNPDGSPMMDEKSNAVTATVFGPGTKIWQTADAHRRRKAIKRSREANGKYEASVDRETEDQIEFLCTITKSFNNLDYPGVQGDKETVKAVYNDDLLGFIRDHMDDDTKTWENFMRASQMVSPSTSDNLPG